MNTWTRSTEALTDRLLSEAQVPRSLQEYGGRIALVLITLPGVLVILLAAIGPWIAPQSVGASIALPFLPPGEGFLFGTDRLGRDLWSQILHGGRGLLIVPLVATVATVAVGTAVGMTMGYLQGRVETVLLAVTDVLLVLPPVIVLLVLASGWGGGAPVIVLTMVLTGAPFLARLARAATLEVCRAPFVLVSITQGDSTFTILRRDVLPNVAGPVLADSGMRFVGALYLAAALSLLGFGPQAPETNWAVMIRENAEGAGLNLWALVLPASMIALMSISANFILQAFADRIAR
ncbi:MAG: ABC transporter permease [Dehalococcoidia bacterium]|nr:ABC transporter permease [Dehalococcoidia bacterium]MYB49789.1 ABC transporter permease [Dehalococcoidia bacterium]